MQIALKILDNGRGLEIPQYATPDCAGMDLRAAISGKIIISAGERALIPAGVAIALPVGYEAQIRSRSGLALKYGVTVLNAPGTIDSDYRGELGVLLFNTGHEDFIVERGMRIAQLVVSKFETVSWNVVDDLDTTVRASGGYGSTGTK